MVEPAWLLTSPAHLTLTRDSECEIASTDDAMRFSLWQIPGRKTLLHLGNRIRLSVLVNRTALRLSLTQELCDGAQFAFAVPAVAGATEVFDLVARVLDIFSPHRQVPRASSASRPARQSVTHMRVLQAIDGEAVGATQREIAEAVFGAREVFERWATDSELRAQVRYLLRRGHELINGGYLHLLTQNRDGQAGRKSRRR